jgi:hypothetical protein
MSTSDLFDLLLGALDDIDRVFDYEETYRWPAGQMDALRRQGLLRQATAGLHAPCPNCDRGHIEPVTIRVAPDGTRRFYIQCPESMRVPVEPDMCVGWEVDAEGMARAIASALRLNSKPKAVSPGRLWRLGRVPWRGTTREVILAIRMHDDDAASIAAHIGPGGRAIVFVPRNLPDERVWPGHVPAVVALSRLATLGQGGIELDVAAMTELVADADAAAEARSSMPVDPEVKKQVVRQQVKAEIKGQLEDDILVAAYKTHGSYRKAAEALTEQTGQTISKDKVSRAVKRAGGVDALRESDDSASVARTVASHSRDRGKKFIERR